MLVLLPPSESKSMATRGKPLDLAALSWPELTSARSAVIQALGVLVRGDAARAHAALGVSARMVEEVERDRRLLTAPALRVERLYSGVLYDALDLTSLEGGALRWARRNIVIVSALFGALRLPDRVPPYRLSMCTRLPGPGHLTSFWRRELPPVLAAAARRGVVADMRSTDYLSTWRPRGPLADRHVTIQVRRRGKVVSHDAKHVRGLVARHLAEQTADPRTAAGLAEVVAARWAVELTPAGDGWRLDVITD